MQSKRALVDVGVVAYEIGCDQTHGVERIGCPLTAVRAQRIRLDVYAAAASCSGLQRDRWASRADAGSLGYPARSVFSRMWCVRFRWRLVRAPRLTFARRAGC
jgi:hypothetical protein